MNTEFNVGPVKVEVIKHDYYTEIYIPGSDEFLDYLISAMCWPNLSGRHFGCDLFAKKIYDHKRK